MQQTFTWTPQEYSCCFLKTVFTGLRTKQKSAFFYLSDLFIIPQFYALYHFDIYS